MSDDHIKQAIYEYAKAYEKLQILQENEPSIPEGDQKTGCIGEYYSYRYLSCLHADSDIEYGSHSEKGWDIKVVESGDKVQVKTVSAYSKTRTISPIHLGWDILHLIYLNKALKPEGFWVIVGNEMFGSAEVLKSKKCRLPGNPRTGSTCIPFGENKISDLLSAVNS